MRIRWFQYAELLSLLLALVCQRGLRRLYLGAFIPILLTTNIVEIVGVNFRQFGWTNNYFLYNYNILLQTPLYLVAYYHMLRLKQNEKPVFGIIAGLCLVFILVNYFFLQGPELFNTYSIMLLETICIVYSALVLLRLLVEDTEDTRRNWKPYLWINAGTLLLSLVSLVLLGLQQYIVKHHMKINNHSLYYAWLPAVITACYLCYSYAFILCRRTTN